MTPFLTGRDLCDLGFGNVVLDMTTKAAKEKSNWTPPKLKIFLLQMKPSRKQKDNP